MARSRLRPVLTILVLAPVLGECLSTATAPLELLVWGPLVLIPLYGCGALLCRELARRFRLGTLGLALLAAAYAVYEEALVDDYWFDPGYAARVGVGDYGRVWGTSLVLATHLTAFHVVVSIGASIVLVERLFPAFRHEPWLRLRWLVLPAPAFASVPLVTWETYERGPLGPVVASAGLFVVLIAAAFLVPRGRTTAHAKGRYRPRPAALVAFACTAVHFVLVYTVASSGLAWPLGLALTLVPIVAGVRLVPRGAALPGLTGVLAFFVLLAGGAGLGGRYDFTVVALALAVLLRRLNRRERLWCADG
ncbi:hypothetical protein [Cryptosporangium sp. NPDC051539]|uniref:hypothetical protein n=1 Tax=Cryptosporangium sp. NPDC051539 TaxID=3363962 RepID=UPI00379C97FB